MKIEYNNLYTHFVFSTLERQALIPERNRVRIEKYITGFKYPIKIVVSVKNDIMTVITNYPLKKGRSQ